MSVILASGINYYEVMTKSGPVGISVLGVLIFTSVVSWGIIFRKYLQMRRAARQTEKFLEGFWQSKRLDQIFQSAEKLPQSPVSQVFRAGYIELSKVTQQSADGEGMKAQLGGLENVERALKRASVAELTHLERSIPFLGTAASASPFVGLFGTVWGIMNAFSDIYEMGNANLATVAKPISEALIATAFGLFAAIPAVVAYNYFLSKIKVLDSEMESFSSDFLNIVKRHFLK